MATLVKQIMTGLHPSKWQAPARNYMLASDPSHKQVRLIELPLRIPATEAETFAIDLLRAEKAIDYRLLVSRIAEFLYRKELRAGGWAVDIGLFGKPLFIAEAGRVLEAGNGELWEIE